MRVGLLVAVGIVLEQRHQQVAGLGHLLLALDLDPCLGKIFLGPGQRLSDRLHVSVDNPLIAADQGQQRPALGHRKGEIGAGPVIAVVAPDPAPIRQHALEHRLKHAWIDLAFETLLFGAFAEPRARAVSVGPGVIIIGGKIAGGTAGSADIGNR